MQHVRGKDLSDGEEMRQKGQKDGAALRRKSWRLSRKEVARANRVSCPRFVLSIELDPTSANSAWRRGSLSPSFWLLMSLTSSA
jgi:hypothetical protein